MLAALADSKANVRQAAVKTMNTIMTETSVRDMLVSDIFPSALGKGNPFVKQEIFGWFGANLMGAKVVAKEELMACLSVLFSSLEDRSADVRKAAQEAIIGFMKHLGFPAMAWPWPGQVIEKYHKQLLKHFSHFCYEYLK